MCITIFLSLILPPSPFLSLPLPPPPPLSLSFSLSPPSLSLSLISPLSTLPLSSLSPSPSSLQDEWEALQVVQHKDALHKIEETLVEQKGLKLIYSDIPLTDPKRKKMF